jgi:hypothetical protein
MKVDDASLHGFRIPGGTGRVRWSALDRLADCVVRSIQDQSTASYVLSVDGKRRQGEETTHHVRPFMPLQKDANVSTIHSLASPSLS